jgi:hypothetical protein
VPVKTCDSWEEIKISPVREFWKKLIQPSGSKLQGKPGVVVQAYNPKHWGG